MAGCGLGSYVIDPEGGGVVQAFAATTNGTAATKFFGIVSGTSNCVPDEGDKKAELQEKFIRHNLSSLAKEITQGEGETLAAFTEALGCSAAVAPAVRMELKSNAQTILAAPGGMAVLESIKGTLKSRPEIGQNCQYLS